jgi:hypothetical protein
MLTIFIISVVLFLALQVVVPIRVSGMARLLSFAPLSVLLLLFGALRFAFRHWEGGWSGFPAFLFLLVGIPAATIALAIIWVASPPHGKHSANRPTA